MKNYVLCLTVIETFTHLLFGPVFWTHEGRETYGESMVGGISWWAWAGKLLQEKPGETKLQIHVGGTYFPYLNHTFQLSLLPTNHFVLWVHLNINPLIASKASLPNFLMRILICAPKVVFHYLIGITEHRHWRFYIMYRCYCNGYFTCNIVII